MGDDPIAGFESFVDHRDDEEEPLQVPIDSDNSEGSNREVAPITDNQPSMTRLGMSQSQDHLCHYSSLNLNAIKAHLQGSVDL